MLHQCLDVRRFIYESLHLQSLVNLLNCNNKQLYWDVMKYIKWKIIHKKIIRYDVNRFHLFGLAYYHNMSVVVGEGCSLDVLKILELDMDKYLMACAAQSGNLDNMKWLKQEGCPWDADTFSGAIENGNLDNMKWLKQHGCSWNSYLFSSAAYYGNLDTMKWLRKEQCPWNKNTFESAARNGNLDNMKWLKRHGCPWNCNTFLSAVSHGNLDNLEWLRQQECPYNTYIFKSAKRNASSAIKKWFIKNFPMSWPYLNGYNC